MGKNESNALTFPSVSHPHLSYLKGFIHRIFNNTSERMRDKIHSNCFAQRITEEEIVRVNGEDYIKQTDMLHAARRVSSKT